MCVFQLLKSGSLTLGKEKEKDKHTHALKKKLRLFPSSTRHRQVRMSQRSHTHRHSLNALLPVSNGQVFVALVFCFFFNQRHRPSEFSEQRPSQSSVGISPIAETRWHQSRSRLGAVSQTTTIINSKITTTTTTAARPTRQKSKRTTFPGKKCFFSFFDSLSCRRLLLLLFGLFYLFEYVNVTLYDDKKAHSPFCGR